MNPLLIDILAAVLRSVLIYVAAKLTASGVFDESLAARVTDPTVATGITVFAATVGWSIYAKYRTRLKLVTALSMPVGSSESDVENRINSAGPALPIPPVTSPKDAAPIVPPAA